mgnify:FL=1
MIHHVYPLDRELFIRSFQCREEVGTHWLREGFAQSGLYANLTQTQRRECFKTIVLHQKTIKLILLHLRRPLTSLNQSSLRTIVKHLHYAKRCGEIELTTLTSTLTLLSINSDHHDYATRSYRKYVQSAWRKAVQQQKINKILLRRYQQMLDGLSPTCT